MKNNIRAKNSKSGKVIIPAEAKPWSHEKHVAQILAKAGYKVEFIPETSVKTPDIYLNRTMYEIKSPISDKVVAIERNLRKATMKCPNVIFDSSRMKISDNKILSALIKRYDRKHGLKKLIFINKRGEIFDIGKK